MTSGGPCPCGGILSPLGMSRCWLRCRVCGVSYDPPARMAYDINWRTVTWPRGTQ